MSCSLQLARGLILCALVLTGRVLLAGAMDCARAVPDALEHGAFSFTNLASSPTGFPHSPVVGDVVSLERNPGDAWPVFADWLTWSVAEPAVSAPLFRGQSPDVSLLPLATGETPIKSTNYLTPLFLGNGRLRGDYVTDFDETDKIGVQVLTQGGLGAGIDAEVNYWRRPVAGLGRESLWTGDLNMMYNLSPIARFKLRSGVGGNWMMEDGDARFGYNVTHGLDIYTLWRFMFTGDIDWGKIDGDDLFRYRVGVGLTAESFDFFTGYESQEIGGERLDGWMNGIAVWY